MSGEKFVALGPLYGDIGRQMAEIVGGNPDGLYLHGSAGPGWGGAAIFRDEGDALRYFDPTDELCELLIDAWEAEEPEKRWSIIEYRITGKSFDAWFTFPNELDPSWHMPEDGREAALVRQFGDKPVIYPPPPGEDDEASA